MGLEHEKREVYRLSIGYGVAEDAVAYGAKPTKNQERRTKNGSP